MPGPRRTSPLTSPATYSFRYGNVGFVALDSNDVSNEIPLNRGFTYGAQTTWLASTLNQLRSSPDVDFIAANERASCRYMKMITLTKLRDGLRDGVFEVRVPEAIAERARVPIERMVAIG